MLKPYRLSSTSASLYVCPQGKQARVSVSFAETAGGSVAVHLTVKSGTGAGTFNWIGTTTIAANETLEVPGYGSYKVFGPGDELFGRASLGAADCIVSIEEF